MCVYAHIYVSHIQARSPRDAQTYNDIIYLYEDTFLVCIISAIVFWRLRASFRQKYTRANATYLAQDDKTARCSLYSSYFIETNIPFLEKYVANALKYSNSLEICVQVQCILNYQQFYNVLKILSKNITILIRVKITK